MQSRVAALIGLQGESKELRSTAWLDGLRGLAAFEVYIFHYLDGWTDHSRGWGQNGQEDMQWWRLPIIRSIYASGDTAVCVFFAISGYVLTHKMLAMLRTDQREDVYPRVASAMFRRGIRLYLPVVVESFILMLLARAGLPKAAGYEDADTLILELKRWFWSFVHLLMPLRYPDRWAELMNVYDGTISWTIPLEYYGSMIVYGTLMLMTRVRTFSTRMCFMAAFVTTCFLKDDWIGAQFLLGMTFADWQLEQTGKEKTVRPRIREMGLLGLFLFGIYLSGLPVASVGIDKVTPRPFYSWISLPLELLGVYKDRKGDRYLYCLAGICLLVAIGEVPRLKRVLETRFVQYLGRISFGLYLCHIFLHAWLNTLNPFYFALVGLDPATAREVGGLRFFGAFCMMMAVSTPVNFAVGSLFEKYLDQPSVRAAHTFEKWCSS